MLKLDQLYSQAWYRGSDYPNVTLKYTGDCYLLLLEHQQFQLTQAAAEAQQMFPMPCHVWCLAGAWQTW